jgi:hypothetical protein
MRIYKTIILPVVLYGCETWSLTLREEHRLRVFENKVLRRIFGVNPMAIVWLERVINSIENPVTSLRIKPVTFQFVAQCLNQLILCVHRK